MVAALLSATALSPATGWAEAGQIRVQTDLEYILSDVDTQIKGIPGSVDTDFSYFKHKYDIQLQKELFPYLFVRGGGLFELIESTTKTAGFETGFDQSATRYFAQLDLNNPIYRAGTAYRRRKFEFDPTESSSTTVNREEISGLWKWKPVGLPSIDLDFNRLHTWDDEDTRDQEVGLLVLRTRYNYQEFASDYTYTQSDVDETILDSGSLTQIHNGGLRYSTDFFRNRLEVTGAARLNYDTLEPTGSGDIVQPTSSPGAEFYLLDDSDPSTLTVVDAANPLTNVNIGRDGPMNDVAVGLDFGPPTEVDTVHVLPREPDQSDPNDNQATAAEIAAIADSFVWRAFISDDQLNWTEQTVTSAIYDVFDNRFEISFSPDADARFVKIVTTPLFNATKGIELAELRAFTTIPGSPGLNLETFTQTYNLGLRWAATANTTASYEGFVRLRESDPSNQSKTTLTNGFSLQHDFTPRLYADARFLRTDTIDSVRADAVRHTYSASLTADHLPTLDQTLVYSGNYDQEGDLSGYANAIFLRTNADVYRDWSLSLDLGYAARTPIRGADSTSTSLRLSTNIAPNPRMYFTLDYRGSWETRSDGPSGFDHNARFQGFWLPIPSLSLFASVALRDDARDERGLRLNQDYSINWAPFPDGLLTFNLGFNQTLDTEGNEVRALTPKIELQITRRSLLTVSFDYGTIKSDIGTTDLNVLRINFRTFF
jgi:hypothetical protein